MRLAVNWVDDNGQNFSAGTIDTTIAPYSGIAVEGETVLSAAPPQANDSGVWVLGSVANPAAVPVTRRADSAVGQAFKTGEIIARIDAYYGTEPALYKARVYDSAQGFDVPEAQINDTTIKVSWSPVIPPADQNIALVYSLQYLDASTGDPNFTLPDATLADNAQRPRWTYKRTDSSANDCTVSVQSGQHLEGVTDGTLNLDPLESATFETDGFGWWRI